jgi:hypothetical protein
MGSAGIEDRWCYVSAVDGAVHGPLAGRHDAVLRKADVLVNVTGSTKLRDSHRRVPIRIYLETDPVAPQIQAAQGHTPTLEALAMHSHRFTFGENLGASDCLVPLPSLAYAPTRQPVVTDWWSRSGSEARARGTYTTVMNWHQEGSEITWQGELYGWSKDAQLLRFIELPRLTQASFELALSSYTPDDQALLERHGWRVVEARGVSYDIDRYRHYISTSMGEFTVAKDQNVRLRSGWFSDRSACYLAAGRPVITQDTGFGSVIPTGRGLFAFNTMPEILEAVSAIASDYDGHSRAAREIAREHFAAERVVGSMLQRAGA